MNTIHVIGISGGKDSTALALRMVEVHPERRFLFLITPTGDELPEMIEHWRMLRERFEGLGHEWVAVRNPAGGLRELSIKSRMLPNTRFRWCTVQLKIRPYEAYLRRVKARADGARVVSYIGLRADEEERQGMYSSDIDVRFPLREWGWGLSEVFQYLKEKSVDIPQRTDCARCPYQRLDEWLTLYREYPSIYADAVEHERELSELVGKPVTIRSPSRDRWPASLQELGEEFEALSAAQCAAPEHSSESLAEVGGVDIKRARRWLRVINKSERESEEGACRVCSL